MDDTERTARIERRRHVAKLIRAMAKQEPEADGMVDDLARDADVRRAIGSLAVAASTLATSLAKATDRSVDDVLDELEEGLASAPVE